MSELRYRVAARVFGLSFGRAGAFEYTSFETHFGGFLVNVVLRIEPSATRGATLQHAVSAAQNMLVWLHWMRWLFRRSDRIQVIVAFPDHVKDTGRQILKGWVPADHLKAVRRRTDPMHYDAVGGGGWGEMACWWKDVFDEDVASSDVT